MKKFGAILRHSNDEVVPMDLTENRSGTKNRSQTLMVTEKILSKIRNNDNISDLGNTLQKTPIPQLKSEKINNKENDSKFNEILLACGNNIYVQKSEKAIICDSKGSNIVNMDAILSNSQSANIIKVPGIIIINNGNFRIVDEKAENFENPNSSIRSNVGQTSNHKNVNNETTIEIIKELENTKIVINGDAKILLLNNNGTPNNEKPLTKKNIKKRNKPQIFKKKLNNNKMKCIGPNGTSVPEDVYDTIKWNRDNYKIATRTLLSAVFGRQVLATHTLSGRPCPANRNSGETVKPMLDEMKVSDIIHIVSRKCGVFPSMVKPIITTKCAHESKFRFK